MSRTQMISIGPHSHPSRVVVAPMAGVSDRPFRNLCRETGAYWTVSEMVTCNTELWHTEKSQRRLAHRDEASIRWVQLAGTEPAQMAEAARLNVDLGAQIIDINMGCPAKKVCKKAAGSALLRDPQLVGKILDAVVAASSVPVTLKIRLGWSPEETNVIEIARIAEAAGIQLLTIHGRTKACKFKGVVNYEAIASVRDHIQIPMIANGDIDSPFKAKQVMQMTGADGVMIGRAAQGRPWLIKQIERYLDTGELLSDPSIEDIVRLLNLHIQALHRFYGDFLGVRIARKHVGWTTQHLSLLPQWQKAFNGLTTPDLQLQMINSISEYAEAA